LEGQEDLVENARQRELDIAKRAGLSEGAVKYIRRRFLEDPSTLSADTRFTVNILLEYRETEISKQTEQFGALADLKGPLRFAKAAQLDINDPAWQSLLPLYQRGQLQLSTLIDSGLGVEHPKVRAATNQLNKVSGMLEQVLDNRELTWRANVETARSTLDKSATVDSSNLSAYVDASRAYASKKSKLGDMQASFATKQVMLFYRNHTLSIHEEATVPSQAESRPGMAILQGAALGLLLGVVIVAFGGRRKAADVKPH